MRKRVELQLTANADCAWCRGSGITDRRRKDGKKLCHCVASTYVRPEPPVIPPPEEAGPERRWEVWMEGYRATGERGTHHCLGDARAISFATACLIVIKEQHPELEKHFDARANKVWGCQLFDNATDAARSFG